MKSKKKQIVAVVVFAALLIAVGCISFFLNKKEYSSDSKEITIEIISERDNYDESEVIKTDEESLGSLMRTMDYCEYEESDYGIYIIGLYDMKEDKNEQYWWCITENGQMLNYGADEVPLVDGNSYEFTLKKGW